jgi:hypothetical protein
MKFIQACGVGISVIAGYLTTVTLTYSAGRWAVPSLIGARPGGLLVALLCLWLVTRCYAIKAIYRKLIFFCAAIGTAFVLYFTSSSVMFHTYVSGFKHATFRAASLAEWQSIPAAFKTYIVQKEHIPGADQLPPFVQKVYPSEKPHAVFTGDFDDQRDICVSVWWRGAASCIGFDIGGKPPVRRGEMYRESVNDQISIVVFRSEG